MLDGPLAGYRILDLTSFVSGPFATMLLGDLGADVIKIESHQGDLLRTLPPVKNGVAAPFLNLNRNKRSIVVDLRKDDGVTLVRRLATRADGLIENLRPGVASRLGLGYAEIRRFSPKIVYCSISGFGPDGPLANAPAFDPIIQGYAGMAEVQGGTSGRPTAVKMSLADKIAGFTAALSMVSALLARRKRSLGQYIRVPMLEALIAFCFNDTAWGYTLQPDEQFKQQAPKHVTLDPFKTENGWITLAPVSDAQFKRLCRAMGHPEWWNNDLARPARVRAVLRNIAQLLPSRPTAEWLPILREFDVPCGPTHNYETLFDDEDVLANEVFAIYQYPGVGGVRTHRAAARFSETQMRMRRIPPRLGEHTVEVLRESGFEREQIEALREASVINRDCYDDPSTH